jgi:hypothetical protein
VSEAVFGIHHKNFLSVVLQYAECIPLVPARPYIYLSNEVFPQKMRVGLFTTSKPWNQCDEIRRNLAIREKGFWILFKPSL